MDIIYDIGSVVCVDKLDRMRVDSLQRFWHLELGAFMNRKLIDSLKQRLKRPESARVALNDHVQLVAVVLTLEQRLFIPEPRLK